MAWDWQSPCQSGANQPIRCQSVNPVPIGQSRANPSPLVSLMPFLTSPELPILISSHGQSLANPGQSGPLGGRIQDNRAFPILTKPFHCQCTANAVWYVVFWWAFIGGFLDELSSVDLYQIHPPRRPGTIPYRALVPRLSRQMAHVNGLGLAEPLPIPGQCTANALPMQFDMLFFDELLEVIVLDEVDWSHPLLRVVHVPRRRLVPRLLIGLAVDWHLS